MFYKNSFENRIHHRSLWFCGVFRKFCVKKVAKFVFRIKKKNEVLYRACFIFKRTSKITEAYQLVVSNGFRLMPS